MLLARRWYALARTVLVGVLLGTWIGCGGVHTSDDQRAPPKTARGDTEDDFDDEVDASTEAPLEPVDAGPPPVVDAAPPVPDGSFAVGTELETTGDLNLREGPGTSFDIIATMPAGTIVKVATTSGADGWVHVDYNATLGHASKQFLKLAP